MPHGMYEAYYSSLGGKSCSKFSVVDGNIQTRMNVINPDRHRQAISKASSSTRHTSMLNHVMAQGWYSQNYASLTPVL